MIKNGAKAYLLKTSGKEEIDKAIQIVQNGEQYISPSVQKVIFEGMSNNSEKKQGYVPPITKREKEILKLIADEFTNKEVAEKLFISVSTVEFHRKNLLEKFNARNSVGLVKSAIEKGLI
jgi:DNA-binding NarL/FixJ family response regulator